LAALKGPPHMTMRFLHTLRYWARTGTVNGAVRTSPRR
jgi:hypothetical protein